MSFFIDLFEAFVAEHPDYTCIKTPRKSYTYKDVNQKANQLAHYLKQQFDIVNPEANRLCMGLHMRICSDLVISILACWKLNVGVVLLDPDDHDINKSQLLTIIEAVGVITHSDSPFCQTITQFKTLQIDAECHRTGCSQQILSNPIRLQCDRALAYYVNTSGSTMRGVSKIVPIDHTIEPGSGIVGAFESTIEAFRLDQNDCVALLCKMTFDLFFDLLSGLLCGSSHFIFDRDQDILQQQIEHQVNVMALLPSKISDTDSRRNDYLKINNLKVMCAGEPLTAKHAERLKAIGVKLLINAYGLTEAVFGNSETVCDLDEMIKTSEDASIHAFMKHCDHLVVNMKGKHRRPVKNGEVGELVFKPRGQNAFPGYLYNDEATEKMRVVINGETWWLTGDKVCYSPDGKKLWCKGRINDRSIKINGVRVELDPIEAILQSHPAISKAETLALQESGSPLRVVTVVAKKDQVTIEALSQYLKERHSRVVNHFILFIDSFSQLNGRTGKLSKHLLRDYINEKLPIQLVSHEERMIAYWRLSLNFADIVLKSNWFSLTHDSLRYLSLKNMLLKDAVFKLTEEDLDNDFFESFKKDPTLEFMLSYVNRVGNRASSIQYYHQKRPGKALFVIADKAPEEIEAYSSEQKIIHIQPRWPGEDSISDLCRSIRHCQAVGPYFIVCEDEQLLAAIAKELSDKNAATVYTSVDPKEMTERYHQLVLDRIRNKIKKNNNKVIIRVDDHHHFPSSGMYSIEDMSTEEQSMLWELDFEGELNYVSSPAQLKAVYKDHFLRSLVSGEFNPANCLTSRSSWVIKIEPGLFHIRDYIEVMTRVIQQNDYRRFSLWHQEQSATVQQIEKDYSVLDPSDGNIHQKIILWYQKQIDRYFSGESIEKKAEKFQFFIHYIRSVAQLFKKNKSIALFFPKIPDILVAPYDRLTDVSRWFDADNPNMQSAFLASPLKIAYRDGERIIEFCHKDLIEILADFPDDNPYRQMQAQSQPKEKLLIKEHIISQNTDNDTIPLLLFPPLTGNAHAYDDLMRLLPRQQPVYAFHHPRKVQDEFHATQMDELISHYVTLIQTGFHPGPLRLMGHSFGGLIASLLVAPLTQLGYEISYLGIIDTPSPELIATQPHNPISLFKWLMAEFSIPSTPVIEAFIKQFEKIKEWDDENIQFAIKQVRTLFNADQHLRNLAAVIDICGQNLLFCKTVPEKIDLADNTHIYRVTEDHPYYPISCSTPLGWNIEEKKIAESDHFSIVKGEAAAVLAGYVQADCQEGYTLNSNELLDDKILVHQNEYTIDNHETKNNIVLNAHFADVLSQERNIIVTGECGVGKSTFLRRIFTKAVEQNQTVFFIPLLTIKKLEDFNHKMGFLKHHWLSFYDKPLLFLLDGVDESKPDIVINLINELLEVGGSQCRFILSSKAQYFNSQRDIYNYLVCTRFCVEVKLGGLTQEEIESLVETNLARDFSIKGEWTKNALANYPKHSITPLLVNQITEIASYLDLEALTKISPGERLYLQVELLKLRASRLNIIAPQFLGKICLDIALLQWQQETGITDPNTSQFDSLYEKCRIVSVDSKGIQALFASDSYRLAELVDVLHLQKTANGWQFSHRSEYERYISSRLFKCIIAAHHDGIINQSSLCYEFDMLDLLAIHYFDFIAKINDTEANRVRHKIYSAIEKARDNPNYKLLAANVISFISVCQDPKLPLPDDLKKVHLGPVNLSNQNLSQVDFTGAVVESVVLDGAILPDNNQLPKQWLESVSFISEQRDDLYLIQRLDNGAIQYLFRRLVETDNIGFYQYSVQKEGDERPKPMPELQMPGTIRSRDPGHVAIHPNGKYTAILTANRHTAFELNNNTQLSWWGTDDFACLRLQLFENGSVLPITPITDSIKNFINAAQQHKDRLDSRGNLKPFTESDLDDMINEAGSQNSYYLIPEHNRTIIREIFFHPEKPIIFAINHHHGKNKIYIFDPLSDQIPCVEFKALSVNKVIFKPLLNQWFIAEGNTLYSLDLNTYEINHQHEFTSKITDFIELTNSNKIILVTEGKNNSAKENTLIVFDTVNNVISTEKKLGEAKVHDIAISKDGEIIAIAANHQLFIWKRTQDTYLPIHQFQEIKIKPRLCFDNSNKLHMIVNANFQYFHQIINLDNMHELSMSAPFDSKFKDILEHPTLPIVIMHSPQQIKAYDKRSLRLLWSYKQAEEINTMCLSKNGKCLLINKGKEIHSLSVNSGIIISDYYHPALYANAYTQSVEWWNIWNIAIHPYKSDYLLVATSGESGLSIYEWDYLQKNSVPEPINQYYPHNGAAVKASEKHGLLIFNQNAFFAGGESTIYSDRQKLLEDPSEEFRMISNKNGLIISYNPHHTKKIKFYTRQGLLLAQIEIKDVLPPEYAFTAITLSPDDQYLIICQPLGLVTIFDLTQKLKQVDQFLLPSSHGTAALYASSDMIYIGTDSGSLYIYHKTANDEFMLIRSLTNTQPNTSLERHKDKASFLSHHNDQSFLLLQKQNVAIKINLPEHFRCYTFSDNFIFIGTDDRKILFYDYQGVRVGELIIEISYGDIKELKWFGYQKNYLFMINDKNEKFKFLLSTMVDCSQPQQIPNAYENEGFRQPQVSSIEFFTPWQPSLFYQLKGYQQPCDEHGHCPSTLSNS